MTEEPLTPLQESRARVYDVATYAAVVAELLLADNIEAARLALPNYIKARDAERAALDKLQAQVDAYPEA